MPPKKRETFLPKMEKKPPFSIELHGVQPVSGETRPRVHIRCKDGLITSPDPSIETAYDLVPYAARNFGNAKGMGSRDLISKHKATKKVKKMVDGKETDVDKDWVYFELGPYKYITYHDFKTIVDNLGSGLAGLGLGKGDRIHLYGATSLHWLSMAHAAFTCSCTIVTAYDTLGIEGLTWSIQQTQSKAIFLDAGLLPAFTKALKEGPLSIKTIILNNDAEPDTSQLETLKADFPALRVLSYDDLQTMGSKTPTDPTPPAPEDLTCIMYTSGSSGPPKGVTIKHKAIVAAVAGVNAVYGDILGPGDRLLTYLPQAHIIEFLLENTCLFWGCTTGYGSPRTLAEESVSNCHGDIREFQPTILIGVPAVWENIRKGIVGKASAGFLTSHVFWGALKLKHFLLAAGIPGVGVIDTLVFRRVRDATGGKLRVCLTGGGPISKDTQTFISMTLAPLVSGYGLTETTGMGAMMDPLAWTADSHGDIACSLQMKLVDFPEAGYLTANDPPQGELLIKGPSVTEEYFDNEAETKAAIREDGWFATGDIAEFDKNGHLRIIDRKKNLVKTLNGEYIALEKLESIYRGSPLVGNICIYAAADQSKPMAIIVPVEKELMKLARENGVDDRLDLGDLAKNEKVKKLVLRALQRTGQERKLAGFEVIQGVVLDTTEWTSENGLVTPAQKIQRRKIIEKNRNSIDEAYGKH